MASLDEKQQDPTMEDDGWQVQDKKKINKKKTSAPTGTTTHVEDKKFERKPFDTKGDAKGAFRTNGESSGISSWRKGAAGTGTTQQTPTKLKDATKANDIRLPYQSLLVSSYWIEVTDVFSLSYEKAEGDIINTLILVLYNFPRK